MHTPPLCSAITAPDRALPLDAAALDILNYFSTRSAQPMYIFQRHRHNGQPISDLEIRRIEYTGGLWKSTSLMCTNCHSTIERLATPRKKEPRALRCPTCDASDYGYSDPGPLPPRSCQPTPKNLIFQFTKK